MKNESTWPVNERCILRNWEKSYHYIFQMSNETFHLMKESISSWRWVRYCTWKACRNDKWCSHQIWVLCTTSNSVLSLLTCRMKRFQTWFWKCFPSFPSTCKSEVWSTSLSHIKSRHRHILFRVKEKHLWTLHNSKN